MTLKEARQLEPLEVVEWLSEDGGKEQWIPVRVVTVWKRHLTVRTLVGIHAITRAVAPSKLRRVEATAERKETTP